MADLTEIQPSKVLGNLVFPGIGVSSALDNRPRASNTGVPCTIWTLEWYAQASVTSLTINIQGAPDVNGAPGVFATLVSSSIFPNGKLNFITATGYYPWMRVSVSAVGAGGTIIAVLSGYQENATAIAAASSSSGGGGTSDADETPFVVGTTLGTPIMGVVDPIDTPAAGDLVVVATDNKRNLKVSGTFSATPVTSATVNSPGPTTVGTISTTLLAANATRVKVILQNVGTTKIFILFGAGVASDTNYHIALPAGGTANDGSSPLYVDVTWIGAIQAISSAAGGSVQAVEFTP